MNMNKEYADKLSNQVIGLAIDVHRELGPGLLESAYQQCLAFELSRHEIPFQLEKEVPVQYKEIQLDCGFRADLIVDDCLVLELKAVEKLLPIHEAQLLTYLKLTEIRLGLLINFNVRLLKDGIKRMVL